MDDALQKRIEEARAAGYSDDEINAALGGNVATVKPKAENETPVPILTQAERAAIAAENPEVSNTDEQITTGAIGVGMGAAAVGVPYAAYRVGKAVFSPAAQGVKQFAQQGLDLGNRAVDAANRSAGAMEGRTAVDAAREARMASGGAYGRAPTGPVVPEPMPGPGGVRPVAPTGMAAANEATMARPAPSMASRVQAAAAQRISNLPAVGEMLGAAGRLAGRVLGPASLALESKELGPAVPRVGRMRGSEINPMSGRPWTPNEIRAYEANPNMYDQAYLQRPQLPR